LKAPYNKAFKKPILVGECQTLKKKVLKVEFQKLKENQKYFHFEGEIITSIRPRAVVLK